MRLIVGLAIAVSACGPAAPRGQAPAGDCAGQPDLAAIDSDRSSGYLSRALAAARARAAACGEPATRRAVAQILGDLGLDAEAVSAWQAYATVGAAARQEAEAAIAELRRRPSPLADVPDARRSEALTLYRSATDLRLQGHHDRAIALFRRSYTLAPHPLTIVQIGLAHQEAGREAEARIAFERALAIAEWRAGKPAEARRVLGHTGSIINAAISPDGRQIATASQDDTVKLWDAATGRELRTLAADARSVEAVAFSPDGTTLASGHLDGPVRMWDPRSGVLLRLLGEQKVGVAAIAYSPDGAMLASAGYYENVHIREAATGAVRRELSTGGRSPKAVAYSQDGRLLAAGTDDVTMIWDTGTGQLIRSLPHQSEPVNSLDFSGDGLLATASERHRVRLWKVADGSLVRTFELHGIEGSGVAFSPDDKLLAYVDGATLRVVSVATGERRHEMTDTISMLSVAFSTDGTRLVTAGGDNARLWDATSGQLLREFGVRPAAITTLAFARNGNRLAAGDDDGVVRIWELDRRLPWSPGSHDDGVRSVAFASSTNLLSASTDKQLRSWDLARRRLRWKVDAEHDVKAVAAAPGGDRIAVATLGVQLLDPETGRRLGHLAERNRVSDVDYRPDGALTAILDEGVFQWAASGDGVLIHATKTSRLYWAPDGETLATLAPMSDSVILWPATPGGEPHEQVFSHDSSLTAFTFHPDGKVLLAANAAGVVHVWNWHARNTVARLQLSSDIVRDMTFRSDGALLAMGCEDGTILLWDAHSFAHLATLVAVEDGRWVVFTPQGEADGSSEPEGSSLIYWQVGDLQLPGVVGWPRGHRPGLLGRYRSTRMTR